MVLRHKYHSDSRSAEKAHSFPDTTETAGEIRGQKCLLDEIPSYKTKSKSKIRTPLLNLMCRVGINFKGCQVQLSQATLPATSVRGDLFNYLAIMWHFLIFCIY